MVSEKSPRQKLIGSQFSLSNYFTIRNEYLHGEAINAIPGLKHNVAHIEAKSIRRFQNKTDYVRVVSKQDTCNISPKQIPVRLSLNLTQSNTILSSLLTKTMFYFTSF